MTEPHRQPEPWVGGCFELAERFGVTLYCCDSCHQDSASGEAEMMEAETDRGAYYVCCEMYRRLEDSRIEP